VTGERSARGHVELRRVTKRFGATTALDDVTVCVVRGTVHAVVGENGAGKSTLGKIISGVVSPDAGQLFLSGRPVTLRSPRQGIACGLTMIAQELCVVPDRQVIENVYLGIEDHRGPFVRRASLRGRFAELVDDSGIAVPGDACVHDLDVAQQQKVEILRALARNAELIVMDEPTARLAAHETRALHATIRRLAARGTTVVFISHFIDEVLQVADTVTMMRDGRVVRTAPAAAETRRSLIEGMTGRPMGAAFPARRSASADAPEVLRVVGLGRAGSFADVSFSVKAGEIVALAGLVGAGRSEVMRALYGADRADSGMVHMGGTSFRRSSPQQSIERGIAMIPESRNEQGLVLGRSVRENMTLPYLRALSRHGFVASRREREQVGELVRKLSIKTASPDAAVASLSGGNQQKLLFARALMRQPRVLIADEPTRGVDVGAKQAIYELLVRLAATGTAVLVVSSELEEVLGLADRVLVMRAGRIVAELAGDAATETAVMEAAFAPTGPERSARNGVHRP
jgi:rhamnose transport system ATP-binding protein